MQGAARLWAILSDNVDARKPRRNGPPWIDPRRSSVGAMRRPHTSTFRTVTTALLWVVLGLGSLASTVVALWICTSLAHGASAHDGGGSHTLWAWFIAVVITLGIPFAIAAWQSAGDSRSISLTMTWLPMLWNTAGIALGSQLIPDLMGSALRSHGAWTAADRLGDTHSATRVLSALGHHTADVISPPPIGSESIESLGFNGTLQDPAQMDHSRAISVPMVDGGTAIFVNAVLEGKAGHFVELPYLFDTGASFTTISTQTAADLGIEIPDNAPVLTFNTASGPRESRMVYLPAVRIGQVRVEGLLVSVCDGCVNKRHFGLLGQNVMRRFFVEIDFLSGRTLLVPRILDDRPNRAYDIEPVVAMDLDGAPEVWLGRIRWIVTVKNNGTVPIHDVTPVVRFTDGPALRGKVIPEIPPGGVGRSLVEGRASDGRGNSKGHYQLVLAEAYW